MRRRPYVTLGETMGALIVLSAASWIGVRVVDHALSERERRLAEAQQHAESVLLLQRVRLDPEPHYGAWAIEFWMPSRGVEIESVVASEDEIERHVQRFIREGIALAVRGSTYDDCCYGASGVRLQAIGRPALPALERALESAADPAVRFHLRALRGRIEGRPRPSIAELYLELRRGGNTVTRP